MAGINLSQLNIPKSEEPIKRKHVIRLDELSDAYSNPEKKQESLNNERPMQMREIRQVRGVENEPVKKGELTKPESKIERIDKQLEKIGAEKYKPNTIASTYSNQEYRYKIQYMDNEMGMYNYLKLKEIYHGTGERNFGCSHKFFNP